MRRLTVLLQTISLLAIVLCIATTTTVAQDMAKVAPDVVKVLLDNDQVRVFDVNAKAGGKLPMHSHPNGYVIYSFSNGTTKTSLPDGKVSETQFKAGEARWNDAIVHANEAMTDVHVLVIEVKPHKGMKKK